MGAKKFELVSMARDEDVQEAWYYNSWTDDYDCDETEAPIVGADLFLRSFGESFLREGEIGEFQREWWSNPEAFRDIDLPIRFYFIDPNSPWSDALSYLQYDLGSEGAGWVLRRIQPGEQIRSSCSYFVRRMK